MTAREFSDLFKPLLPVRTVATAAGFKESTWYTTTTRGRELTADELARLKAAVEGHVDQIRERLGRLD